MESSDFQRLCEACGANAPNDADSVCVRCGAALPLTTPTSVYKPAPPTVVEKWKEVTTEPPIPPPGGARTLIGVVPPMLDHGPGTEGALRPGATDVAAGRPMDLGVTPPPALASSEMVLGADLEGEGEGLPTMPIERLPSFTPAPRPDPQRAPGLADTQRQVAPAVAKESRKEAVVERGFADTLPPPPNSSSSGVALANQRTEPDGASLAADFDPELTPPPLVDGMRAQGRGFDAFDEVSSPERSAPDPSPRGGLPRPAAPLDYAAMGADLAPGSFSDTTANVGAHPVVLGRGGVSPWLLALWVVAIASTVAAILVLVLR